ncbi:MAG: hypothetical protein Q9170_000579 [Blastenia crenularia]
MAALPSLFDDLVRNLLPRVPLTRVRRIARLLLRRLYSNEETEEIRGIHAVTGIDMYLLVAYNVLLDLFMGCTSGGVKVEDNGKSARMLHFRTLDWGMDPLRKVVVRLDFIGMPGGPVIASTVSYVGFVGVLTGMKRGLSVSLNFRPNHNISSRLSNLRFYTHHLLVLLGFRAPIASILRQCIVPSRHTSNKTQSSKTSLESIIREIPPVKSTASYLIFCDGIRTVTMEKDYQTAIIRSSEDFIVACNHDQAKDAASPSRDIRHGRSEEALQTTGMDILIEESTDRQSRLTKLWRYCVATKSTVTSEKLKSWIGKYPITNEETHFATIMDPAAGVITWVHRYVEPVV